MSSCLCSQCFPGKPRKPRTILVHLHRDRALLNNPSLTHSPQTAAFLQRCIEANESSYSLLFENLPDIETPEAEQLLDIEDIQASQSVDCSSPKVYHSEEQNDDDDIMLVEEDLESEESRSACSDTSETPMLVDFPDDEQPIQKSCNPHPPHATNILEDLDMNEDQPSSFTAPCGFSVPSLVKALHETLLQGYTLPENPPLSPPDAETLNQSEELTLKHYIAWYRSGGTVDAYKRHAKVLQDATGQNILSLHLARKLAARITELTPVNIDICPNSCIAYTGEFEDLSSCPHIRDRKVCNEPRFKPVLEGRKSSVRRPRAQMMTLPIMSSIRAMYSSETSSVSMRHRDNLLQQTLHLVATAAGQTRRTYSDFADSNIHVYQHSEMGLFQDPRDVALALSTDGAQLTMKKLSDTWLVIIIIFNLSPALRYMGTNIIHAFATPGPNPPGNIESFAYTLYAEMARASEGIWTWDAVESSYFVLRAWIAMILGDMLGSAKLSGMAGHLAIYGDRFSMIKAARSNLSRGSKYLYYPMDATEPSNLYNPGRTVYSLSEIPYRSEEAYWDTITKLSQASNKGRRAIIVAQTGVSRMPLCVAGGAFIHPSYFPLDPFHLFYENCMTFIWDIWTINSSPDEIFHLSAPNAAIFGQLVAKATTTLPPSFCGPIRDPHLKRNSQYKIYEWMALLHWYIIPLGIELKFNQTVLNNFSYFVEGVEAAMTVASRSPQEIAKIFDLFANFLHGFEAIYVGKNPDKISRCRLCIFQLIHVPQHIYWNGSIRIGSQATCERAIGEVGHKIRSKKAPFAHLANIIYERELIKILALRVPALREATISNAQGSSSKLFARSRILKRERTSRSVTDFTTHFEAIEETLKAELADIRNRAEFDLERWGKFKLSEKAKLNSHINELQGDQPSARLSRFFEASLDGKTEFGEAIAFYAATVGDLRLGEFVVYRPVVNMQMEHRRWRGKWGTTIRVARVSSIVALVGVWIAPNSHNVHILRKHPGLDLLSQEECGLVTDDSELM